MLEQLKVEKTVEDIIEVPVFRYEEEIIEKQIEQIVRLVAEEHEHQTLRNVLQHLYHALVLMVVYQMICHSQKANFSHS